MTRARRLDSVRGLEDRKTEEIGRQLALVRRQLDQRRQQLERLREYASEYGQGEGDAQSTAMLQERRAFLARLQEAVAHAQSSVDEASREYATMQKRWQRAKERSRALEGASDRLREDERIRRDRQAQRDSDELAGRGGSGWGRD